jgi:hypothetical protein
LNREHSCLLDYLLSSNWKLKPDISDSAIVDGFLLELSMSLISSVMGRKGFTENGNE